MAYYSFIFFLLTLPKRRQSIAKFFFFTVSPSGEWLWRGLRSRRNLSDSDSGLKILTPTPAPTPLRLRPKKRHSILKRAIWCGNFHDFHIDFIQADNVVVLRPFALSVDAAGLIIADSFECYRCDSLWICWHSHIVIAMTPKLSPIPSPDEILSLNGAWTLSPHCHSPFLPAFQCSRDDA